MNFKNLRLMALLCLMPMFAFSQYQINGAVADDSGQPLIGATIVEVGVSDNGTLTDLNGEFTLSVASSDSEVKVSYIGSASLILKANTIGETPIVLAGNTTLDEVVVTALGITREKRSLPFAVQEVDGAQIVQSQENNVANALSGKVAGLQVARSSNGPGGSSKIILRGMTSLTGSNQPLIVVDGIPISNDTGSTNNDFWNASPDLGNGLADINPDDIANISVLKGGAAAALYGNRAGNGVILVTTKKGKKGKGLGISYSTSFGFESPFMTPKLQSNFAEGSEGVYNNESTSSWGPKIEGQQVEDWKGDMVPLHSYDNIKNYMDSGFRWTNNLSLQNRIGTNTSLFSSLAYLDDKSMLPNVSLNRLNLTSRMNSIFGENDGWETDFKLQYINNDAQNRPFNGHPSSQKNTSAAAYLIPRTVDITQFRDYEDDNGNMIWYERGGNALNPYWGAYRDLNNDNRDRFLISGSIKNKITPWLTSQLLGGADIFSTDSGNRTFSGGPRNNSFGIGSKSFTETNFTGMLTAQKENFSGKIGGLFMVGGNLMKQQRDESSIGVGSLEVPDLFSVSNSIGNPGVSNYKSTKKINSIYSQLSLNYDTFFFVETTLRNDWSSTLSKNNRSYFYPSVSSTFIFSDVLSDSGNLPNWFEFGKIRLSYATIGNDLPPYQLYPSYRIGQTPNGITSAETNNVLYDPNVINELMKTLEFGIENRFLEGRLGFDFTYYKSNTTNQLIDLPLNPLSGYDFRKVNAGDIENKGFELMLSGRVLENTNFQWSSILNWSRNQNKIVKLHEDVSQITLIGLDNLSIVAAEGETYGQIWGTKYQRVEDENSQHFGKIIVDADGIPLGTSDRFYLGDQQPKALIGFNNDFYLKGFNFGFLVDGRFGGKIFSGTNRSLKASGSLAQTASNDRANFVVDGVVDDGAGGYTVNTTEVSPQIYWQQVNGRTGNLGIHEENIYDATNVRLRNIYANYAFDKQEWVSKLKMQNLKLGFSMNNVLMFKSHLNGVDPESIYATSSNGLGFESLSAPTSRTFFININAGF